MLVSSCIRLCSLYFTMFPLGSSGGFLDLTSLSPVMWKSGHFGSLAVGPCQLTLPIHLHSSSHFPGLTEPRCFHDHMLGQAILSHAFTVSAQRATEPRCFHDHVLGQAQNPKHLLLVSGGEHLMRKCFEAYESISKQSDQGINHQK